MNHLYKPDKVEVDDIERIDAKNLPKIGAYNRNMKAIPTPDLPEAGETELPEERGWFINFLAGDNAAGKVGAVVKDIVLTFLPYGPLADKITDKVGDSLKKRPSYQPTTRIMKDKKTTIFGIVTLLITVASLFGIDFDQISAMEITNVVVGIGAGLGLLSARDNKRSDED